MTPTELKSTRIRLGYGVAEFGRALGMTGSLDSIARNIRRMEAGTRPIMDWLKDALHDLEARAGEKQ